VTSTVQELIAGIEVEREAAKKRYDKATIEVRSILALASQEGRPSLTAEEDKRVAELFQMRDGAKADQEAIQIKLANAQKIAADDQRDRAQLERVQPSGAPDISRSGENGRPAYDEVIRVTRGERTYHPGNDRSGALFVKDVVRQHLFKDVESGTRLATHMAEERVERASSGHIERAVGTGAFTGLVVPQYLTDMYAPAVAAMRPFADVCNHHDLPAYGMTVNISRITTASAVGLQATENTAVTNTDMDDTLLTEVIQTAAGQQTISRQAAERGVGIEEVVVDDLFRRYATALDSTLINQTTTGLSAVASSISYDDASPSGVESWPKILAGAASSEAALLGFAQPDVVLMHSRRWYWLQSQLTNQFPLFGQPGITDTHGGMNYAERYGRGVRGVMPNGMVAVVDNNIAVNLGTGTNQDEMYVLASDECHLWEDPAAPVFLRAEQPAAASLGILLVLYGYFAYSFRRYAGANAKIGGTGFVSPTF
jgi:hypothetical protein